MTVERRFDGWHLAGALLMVGLAITWQSLWIDEAFTWSFAAEPSWATFFHRLGSDINSDAQMPGFLILAKLLLPVLGSTEYALRAINLLWGWAAVGAMWGFFRMAGQAWLVWILALHPFFWYYLDEARPYAAEIAGGAGLLYGFMLLRTSRRLDLGLAFLVGGSLLVLCATTLAGAFPALAGALILGWLIARNEVKISRAAKGVLAGGVVLLAALGIYYGQTILRGAAGARHWELGPGNVLFCFYEWLGFSGAGPGRTILRDAATQGTQAIAAALMAHTGFLFLVAMAWIAAVGNGCMNYRNINKSAMILALLLAGGTVVIGGVGFGLFHFPFWGRHFAAALPAMAAVGGLLMAARPAEAGFRRGFSCLAATLLLASLGASSAALRWDESKHKEDYRWAVGIAQKSLREGKMVWWVADPGVAKYYGLPLAAGETPGHAVQGAFPLANNPPPDVIILSRPDLFDADGKARGMAATLTYREITHPGFQVWEKTDR